MKIGTTNLQKYWLKYLHQSTMLVSRLCIYKRSLWASQYTKQDFGLVEWLAGVAFQYCERAPNIFAIGPTVEEIKSQIKVVESRGLV